MHVRSSGLSAWVQLLTRLLQINLIRWFIMEGSHHVTMHTMVPGGGRLGSILDGMCEHNLEGNGSFFSFKRMA